MDMNMQAAKSQTAPGDISDQIEILKSEFSELAGKLAAAAKEQAGEMQDAAAGKLRETVRANPMQATLVTAGIGFVLGLLLTR